MTEKSINGVISAKKIYLLNGSNDVVENAGIEIQNGKIKRILNSNDMKNVKIIASGEILTPGFVDAHTHLGLYYESFVYEQKDGNEATNPLTPEIQALDGIWPQDTCFNQAREGGITTACVTPGSANVIGGVVSVIKTAGERVDDMIIRHPAGIKCALGINPKTVYKSQKKAPTTRMATAHLLRKTLIETKEYMEKKKKIEEPEKKPPYDQGKENLCKVLKKEIPLRIHCARSDDLYTALRIQKEFDIDIVLDHAYEAHMAGLPEILAKQKTKVILGPSFRVKGSSESQNFSFKTAKILLDHGLDTCQMTDHPVIPIQYLPIQAALCVKEGLPYINALKSITINAAKILQIDDRVGSIEIKKDADLVLFNGDPLDPKTNVLMTFINGKKVFDRETKNS
ncbi:MAG: Imidazolonepropionase [Candidatus Heimdallarchaeota archaeon LC_3]|nr:MAG: Imidazolonepropionase [Candidatus Heimdallarchaeota archaeon LC_3]